MLMVYFSILETDDDKKRMTEIYEKYRLFCIHIAMKITDNLSYSEDAVHNAFLEIIKRKEKMFKMECSVFEPTLVIIVKNKAIDILRKQKKISSGDFDTIIDTTQSEDIQLDEQVSSAEQYAILMKRFNGLNDNYKAVLHMKYFEGLSNSEIAEHISKTNKHVETILYRAKESLKKSLMKEDGFDG